MFPLPAPRRIADTLLELADAVLRPLPDDEHGTAPPDAGANPGVQRTTAPHPHRQLARIPRKRRGGTPPPPAHHCLVPLPPRTATSRRTPSRA
jgi:hypothetical protein